MSKNIKFRWVAFFHLHFWQLFFFVFQLILYVKSSIFHQLSNAIKIISTRGQTKKLWAKLQSLPTILKCTLVLKDLTLQSAVFGFLNEPEDSFTTTNHILLIFKIFLYKYRNRDTSPAFLFACIKNVATIEGHLCISDKDRQRHNRKWGNIVNFF